MAPPALAIRDTDADWKALGESEPYWGVLTQPQFLSANLTPEALEAFYASGAADIAGFVERLEQTTGVRPRGRALDFGCGAGRLTEAMAACVDEAVGFDISPGMLARARARGGRAAYTDVLPGGAFDWINAFIVFQHIPPARGLPLMAELLSRLAPGGHLSLHVTIWREPHLVPAPRSLRRPFPGRAEAQRLAALPEGTMTMHDYDLGEVVKLVTQAGVPELTLVTTNHGGHHGAILLGRRTA